MRLRISPNYSEIGIMYTTNFLMFEGKETVAETKHAIIMIFSIDPASR